MTLFELLFGLSAVILGLALTHIAASLQRLFHAGRRVRWAPEPVLLTSLVLLVIVTVWINQWSTREVAAITIFQALLQVLKLLAIYFAAASVLPEGLGRDERIDLFDHYDQTRWLSYGALIVGLILILTYSAIELHDVPSTFGAVLMWLLLPAIYLSLILVRWRPYNVAALVFALLFYGLQIWSIELTN